MDAIAALQAGLHLASSLHTRLAVGTDMAVGKMSVCLELLAAAEHCSHPVRFIGTGQAGILISGDGVALDAVRVDYAAGAVEAAVMRAGEGLPDHGLILVEGQGSLCHPGSTATLRGCVRSLSTQPGWMTGMQKRLLRERPRNSVFPAAILFAGEDKACFVPLLGHSA